MAAPAHGFVRGTFDDFEIVSHLVQREASIAQRPLDFTQMQTAGHLPDLLAGFARSIVGAVGADACLISLVDKERDVIRDVAASVVPPVKLNSVVEEHELASFPVTRWVVDTGNWTEISLSDPHADPAERSFLHLLGFARVLMCRFIVEGIDVGTVEAYRVLDIPFGSEAPGQIDILSSYASNAYSRIQLAEKLELHYMKTMEALVSALEARDPYTEAHAGRITGMAEAMAIALHLNGEAKRAVRLGAILHDVGKIGIPDSILRKEGPLTDEEWSVMKTHSLVGERMLQGVDFLAPALPIVRNHHERWDGSGYPDGLAGEDIPMGARIVAVCDAFDAMTSDRPYRRALPADTALAEVAKHSGTQFDPACASLLVDFVGKMGDGDLGDRFIRYAS